jgi:hypothetical protein
MVVLCVALFTLLVLFLTRTPHLPSLPPLSPNCYLPKSGRHVTSLDQGISSSEARSGKNLGTKLSDLWTRTAVEGPQNTLFSRGLSK